MSFFYTEIYKLFLNKKKAQVQNLCLFRNFYVIYLATTADISTR